MEYVSCLRDCRGTIVRPSLLMSRLKEINSLSVCLVLFVTIGCSQDICRLSAGWSNYNYILHLCILFVHHILFKILSI